MGSNAQAQIRSLVERLEALAVEKAELGEVVKEVFAEAKGNGYDVKTLRRVLQIRKMDYAKRLAAEALLDLYLAALGELPLFETLEQTGEAAA